MKFSDYFEIIRNNYTKKDNKDNICILLFNSIIKPLDLRNEKGDPLIYSSGRLSEYITGKKTIPDILRDNVYEQAVTESITDYFEKEVIPKLVPNKDDICHQIMQLVEYDPALSGNTKGNLRMIANPKTLAAFLAQTFAYAIRGDNTVITSSYMKSEDSSPSSFLHLVGIHNDVIDGDRFFIESFQPVLDETIEESLDKIDDLLNQISEIHLDTHRPTIMNGWLASAQNKPVEIEDSTREIIKEVAKKRGFAIPEDFFNLGDLSRNPFKDLYIITGGSNIEGSDDARKKYRLINTLYDSLNETVKHIHIEDEFKNTNCVKLAVMNSGGSADQDISITLSVPYGAVKKPADLMTIDQIILDDLLSEHDACKVFGIKRSAQYLDYNSSIVQGKSVHPSLPIRNISPFGTSQRTEDELIEDYSAVFDYYYDQCGDNMLITLDYDEIMHNTAVAFPTVLLLNKEFKLIKYTIRSRNMSEVYSGSITLAD